MQHPRILVAAAMLPLCLPFTGERPVRADSTQVASVSSVADVTEEEPYTPTTTQRGPSALLPSQYGPAFALHQTWGPSFRIGTVVGTVDAQHVAATGLGLSAATGHRFGRLALESEAMLLRLQEQGPSSLALGTSTRFGVIVRYDVVRVGSKVAGPNTMLAMFVEGGAAKTWNHWYAPSAREPARWVPEDVERLEGQAGMGVAIDHRITPRTGYPTRFAWQLGWRLAAPPPVEEPYACRGSCLLAMPAPSAQVSEGGTSSGSWEGSILFQSSLALTW